MLIKDYLKYLTNDINIILSDISLIYKNANPKGIFHRLYNQLIFFENINIENKKIVDIGSGLGVHANYFLMKKAKVTCYEPNFEVYSHSLNFFKDLEVKNSIFDTDENFNIATMFGVSVFVEKSYIEKIYEKTDILIIDSASNINLNFNCIYTKKYFDYISPEGVRSFNVYKK